MGGRHACERISHMHASDGGRGKIPGIFFQIGLLPSFQNTRQRLEEGLPIGYCCKPKLPLSAAVYEDISDSDTDTSMTQTYGNIISLPLQMNSEYISLNFVMLCLVTVQDRAVVHNQQTQPPRK